MEPTFHIDLGPLRIAGPVVVTWGIMAVLASLAWALGRKLSAGAPGAAQSALEAAMTAAQAAVEEVLPERAELVLPFIATLWLFIGAANLAGLIPGLSSPTADLMRSVIS